MIIIIIIMIMPLEAWYGMICRACAGRYPEDVPHPELDVC